MSSEPIRDQVSTNSRKPQYKVGSIPRRHNQGWALASTCAFIHVCTHLSTHVCTHIQRRERKEKQLYFQRFILSNSPGESLCCGTVIGATGNHCTCVSVRTGPVWLRSDGSIKRWGRRTFNEVQEKVWFLSFKLNCKILPGALTLKLITQIANIFHFPSS